MTTTTATTIGTEASLQDVLYQLSIAQQVPDADLLDDFVCRYPEHAEALTNFAVELVLDAASGDGDASAQDSEARISPVVARAMSMFQNQLFAAEEEQASAAAFERQSVRVENPFLTLDSGRFRDFAKRINATSIFVMKLRDRQVRPDTMTTGFRRRIADELRTTPEIVAAHFAAAPALRANQPYYKADQKPEVGAQQTFDEAVKSSGLTEEQQRYLVSL